MGFLTVVVLNNDASHEIAENPQEVTRALVDGMQNLGPEDKDHGVGNHSNAILTMHTRHADDETLYMFAGGTLTEVTPKTLAKYDWLREALKRALKRTRI